MNHVQNRAVNYTTQGRGGAPIFMVSWKAMGISAQMALNHTCRVVPYDMTDLVDLVDVYKFFAHTGHLDIGAPHDQVNQTSKQV